MLNVFKAISLLLVGVIAINVRNESDALIVETGAGLDVTFETESCDITSLKYKGAEYQSQLAYSHLASGLGSDAVVKYDIAGTFCGDDIRYELVNELPSDTPRRPCCDFMLDIE